MSSAGKSGPIGWFYQGAHPSDSPGWLRHIFGPITGGRREELKTQAPSSRHSKVPCLGDTARGKPDPREALRPLPAAQAAVQAAPCPHREQAAPCPRREPAASLLPRAVWKLPCSHGVHSSRRDKRQNTCWGITSFPPRPGKAMLCLANVPDCCSLSWQGRTQPSLTPSLSKAAYNAELAAGTC